MKGEYDVHVLRGQLEYILHIRRNITILRGDSGTGKQVLVETISQVVNEKDSQGVVRGFQVICDKPCVVIDSDKYWKQDIQNTHDSIVFIDEYNHKWIKSEDFARAIKGSQNYYVIVQRAELRQLQYSVAEIYELKLSKHYAKAHRLVNINVPLIYKSRTLNKKFSPQIVLTEDSHSGYELWEQIQAYKDVNIKCLQAESKSKILHRLEELDQHDNILVVVDGAAFGCHFDELSEYIDDKINIAVYLPEQTEWLILKSNIINNKQVRDVLSNPSNYIDSKYVSWEAFFDKYIVAVTKDIAYARYNKSKLADFYKQEHSINKIKQVIPDNIDI